jgi:hypothetical protein
MHVRGRMGAVARRPRLTYANVVSTMCLFIVLGGGAWAATSFVGANGRIHGCVTTSGQLILVHPAKSCGAKQSPISWNQTGPKGDRGVTGLTGPKGDRGPMGLQGPGTISINTSVPRGAAGSLGTFSGVTVKYNCGIGLTGHLVYIELGNADRNTTTAVSGDQAEDGSLSSIQQSGTDGFFWSAAADSTLNIDVIAANDSVGKWVGFDLGAFDGTGGLGCNIWGLIIPAS